MGIVERGCVDFHDASLRNNVWGEPRSERSLGYHVFLVLCFEQKEHLERYPRSTGIYILRQKSQDGFTETGCWRNFECFLCQSFISTIALRDDLPAFIVVDRGDLPRIAGVFVVKKPS